MRNIFNSKILLVILVFQFIAISSISMAKVTYAQTTPTVTVATFTSGPQITDDANNGLVLKLQTNVSAYVYYVALTKSNAQIQDSSLTSTQIITLCNGSSQTRSLSNIVTSGKISTTSNQISNVQLPALNSGDYVFYFATQNGTQVSTNATKYSYTVNTPQYLSNYPSITQANGNVILTIATDKTCKAYYVVAKKGTTTQLGGAIDATQVQTWVNTTTLSSIQNLGVVQMGKISMTANIANTVVLNGLLSTVDYTIYVSLARTDSNTAGNLNTMTYITPPNYISNYPKITSLTNAGFNFITQTNKPTTIYSMLCKAYKDSGVAYSAPAKSYLRLAATNTNDSFNFNESCADIFGMLDSHAIAANSTGADIITNFKASLATNTTYVMYSMLKYSDQNGNDVYTAVKSINFKIPQPFSSGYPQYTVSGSGNNTQVNVQAQIDQSGNYNSYYVILKSGISAPTSEQFEQWISGTAATNNNVISKGGITLNQYGNTYGQVSVSSSSLQSSNGYDVYAVTYTQDSSGNGINIVGAPVKAYEGAPVFANSGTPTGSTSLTDLTSGSITLQVNNAANIYCIDSIRQFTSDELKGLDIKTLAGQISNNQQVNVSSIDSGAVANAVPANTSYTINFKNLTANSDHNVYMVLENNNTNKETSIIYGPYVLQDITQPSFTVKYPTTKNIAGTSVDLVVASTKVCTAYYTMIPVNSDTTNNLANVYDAVSYIISGSPIVGAINGSVPITSNQVNLGVPTTINGLASNTAYNIYVALQDSKGNKTAKVSSIQVATTDILVPSITGAPSASMSSLTSGAITLQVNKPSYTNIYCIEYSIDPTLQSSSTYIGSIYDKAIKNASSDDFKTLAATSFIKTQTSTGLTSIGKTSISNGTIDYVTKVPSSSINSSGSCTINMTGCLTSNSDHYVYFILENTNASGANSSVLGPYLLNDGIQPAFTTNYPITRNNTTGNTIDLVVASSKIGTAYYTAIPVVNDNLKSVSDPVSYIIGSSCSITGSISGSVDISSKQVGAEVVKTITGLKSNTQYNIYVALKDWNGNKIAAVASPSTNQTLQVTILDIDAPSITGTSNASMSSLTSGAITLQVNKPTYTNIYCIEYSIDPSKQFSVYDSIIKGSDITAFKNLASNFTSSMTASATNPISIASASISEGSIDFATKIPSNSISSSGSYKISMSGLTTNVDHYVYFVLENTNINGASSSVLGWYKLNDSISPILNSNYPQVADDSVNNGTALDLTVKTNKRCTAYYLVVPQSSESISSTPYETANYLTTHTSNADYSGISGAVCGNFEVSKVDADDVTRTTTVPINGLTSKTAYNIYVAFKDWNGNLSSTVSTLPKTTSDILAPSISAGTSPSGSMSTLTSGSITLQVDKPTYTNIYCIEYSIDPSIQFSTYDSMIKGTDITAFKNLAANFTNSIIGSTTNPISIGSVLISGGSIDFATKIPSKLISNPINMSGLTPNVDHYVYLVLENANTNGASSSVLGWYKLADSIAPSCMTSTIPANNYPQIINDIGTSLDLAVKTNKKCTAYYLVIPKSQDTTSCSTYETTANLTTDGVSYSSISGAVNGKLDIGKADADSTTKVPTTTISGLTSNVAYNIYVALKDWNGNISSSKPYQLSETTLDLNAPGFANNIDPGTDAKLNSDLASGSIKINVNKPSNIYCIEYSIDDPSNNPSQNFSTYNSTITGIQGTDIAAFKNLAANFKNPITASTTSAISIGSKSISKGSIEFGSSAKNTSVWTINMSGLTPNEDHYVYLVLENANTYQASTGVLGPYKLADTLAPSLTVEQATDNAANRGNALDLTVKANRRCTAYYLAVPANSAGTDSYGAYETVRYLTDDNSSYKDTAGNNISGFHGKFEIGKDGANSTGGPQTIGNSTSGWLTSNTAYNIYVALKDWNGNVSSSAPKISVTTADVVPHVTGIKIADGSNSITESSMNISVYVDKPCTLYYYVYPVPTSNDTAPNPGQGDIANDNNTNIITQNVTSAMTASQVTQTINKDCNGNGLIRNCKYYIYVCGKDNNDKRNITRVTTPSTTGTGNTNSIIVTTQTSVSINRICNEKTPDKIPDIGLCRYAMNTNKYLWKDSSGNLGIASIRTIDDGYTKTDGTPKNTNDTTRGYTINSTYNANTTTTTTTTNNKVGEVYGNTGDTSNTSDGASVIWAGQIQPLYTGQHTFTLDTGGDNATVWIKNGSDYTQIIPTSTNSFSSAIEGQSVTSNSIALAAGQKYYIIVHYACSNSTPHKKCILKWACPNTSIASGALITSDRFFPVLDTSIFRNQDKATGTHPDFGTTYDITNYYPILPHAILTSGGGLGENKKFVEDKNYASSLVSAAVVGGIQIGGITRTTASIVKPDGKNNKNNTNIITAAVVRSAYGINNATLSGIQCITSNPNVVTVDCDGKTIRGVSNGIATIYVLSADGVKSPTSCTINVIDPFTINNITGVSILKFIDSNVQDDWDGRIKILRDSTDYIGVKVTTSGDTSTSHPFYDVGDYSDSSLSITNTYNNSKSMDQNDPGDSTQGEGYGSGVIGGSGLKRSLMVGKFGTASDSNGTYNDIILTSYHTYYYYGRYHDVTFNAYDYRSTTDPAASGTVTIKTHALGTL